MRILLFLKQCFTKRCLLLITICSLIALPPSVSAKITDNYQFDIVIFSNIQPSTLQAEIWPLLDANILLQNNGIELSVPPFDPETLQGNNPLNNNSSTDKPSTIQLVAPEDYLIGKDTLNSLQQANHQILLHTSWISPTNKLVSGLRIHLLGGNIYPDQQNTTPLPANSTSTNDPTNNDSSQAIHQIEGQIKLNLNRYFNFNINLVMTEPTAKLQRIDANFNQDNTRGTWSYFQLTQQRRMRSRELNYIDHPLYGMLILIKPNYGITSNPFAARRHIRTSRSHTRQPR